MPGTDRGRSRRTPESAAAFIKPMECTPVADLPDDPAKWLYEVKLDGYRCCAVRDEAGRTMLYSRYGNAWNDRFRKVHEALAQIGQSIVLDGEIVALDAKGLPSFQDLQNWQSTRRPIVFYAFDVLHYGGRRLLGEPLEARKELLASLALPEPIRLVPALEASLPSLIAEMKRLGLEGLVAKRKGTRYAAGERSQWWVKKRFNEMEEFTVGGYVTFRGQIERLLIGSETPEGLRFVHTLKHGFTPFNRRELLTVLQALATDENPFVDAQPERRVHWVHPKLRVEVEFVERTKSGNLRHAFYRQMVMPPKRPRGAASSAKSTRNPASRRPGRR